MLDREDEKRLNGLTTLLSGSECLETMLVQCARTVHSVSQGAGESAEEFINKELLETILQFIQARAPTYPQAMIALLTVSLHVNELFKEAVSERVNKLKFNGEMSL